MPAAAVTMTYSDSVSNGCGGTKVICRVWTATDECGNATNRAADHHRARHHAPRR